MKSMSIALAAFLLVAAMGGAYALWFESLDTNITANTGELDWEFMNNSIYTSDPCTDDLGNNITWPDKNAFPPDYETVIAPEGKDVGCTALEPVDTDSDGDFDTLNIDIYNAYPYYATEVDFRVRNTGTIPLKIWRIVVTLDNGTNYTFTELNPDEVEHEGLYLDLNNDGNPDVIMLWGDNFGVQLETGDTADISLRIIVLQTAPQGEDLHFTISLDAVQWNEYEQVMGGD
ncbi:MAG: hypothetical protein F7C34_05180 [Desulfurococcales archaeon]|nr:hypothetical protein [Desulfurococcales archaeon]